MKYFITVLLVVSGFLSAEERRLIREETCLFAGFQHFKVFTALPSPSGVDRQCVYDAITNSLNKYGQVTTTEEDSIFQHLLRVSHQDALFFLSLDKVGERLTGSIEILAEVEVTKNKQKTAGPIWKKNFSTMIPEGQNNHLEKVFAELISTMVDSFSENLEKPEPGSNQVVFHIQKSQDL